VWFAYLDTLLDDDAISRTLFTFNHHALSHLPHLIKVLGSIRAVSARGLERKIGVVKRVVRSTNKAGVNAGNELDHTGNPKPTDFQNPPVGQRICR
jgi:hypothetical protein